MTKVFAALIFLCLLCGCTKPGFQKLISPHLDSNMNMIYSAPGDFNGDGKIENIYLLKSSDEKYYLKLKCCNKDYTALLNLYIKDFSIWIEDVDGNKKDDLILNSITDDSQSLYVLTYDEDIKLLISPKILKDKIKLDTIRSYYITTSNFKEKNSPIINKAKNAVLFNTDIDIIPGESLFTCDYILSDGHNSIGCIGVSFTIESNGEINIRDVHEFERKDMDE